MILDNFKVYYSKKVFEWVKLNKTTIALFFLPPYTRQYSPDEYLNNDLKREVLTKDIFILPKINLKVVLMLIYDYSKIPLCMLKTSSKLMISNMLLKSCI